MPVSRSIPLGALAATLFGLGLCSCTGESAGGARSETPGTGPATTESRTKGTDLASIQERGTLIVACDASYFPFETIDLDTGKIIGFDIDMMKEIGKRMGVKEVRFDNTEWDGIITALITGKCDVICSGMSVTDERKKKVAFAGPYDQVGQVAMIRAAQGADFPDLSSLDSADVKIAVQLGTTGEAAAKKHMPKAQLLPFPTAGEAANDVLIGNADAMVFDDPFVREFMKKNPDKLALAGDPFTEEPIGIALRLGQDALLEKLNATLAEMQADGTMKTLRQRWRQ